MRDADELELILINLEYDVADYNNHRKVMIYDPSEQAEMDLMLTKARIATLALRIALHGIRTTTEGRVLIVGADPVAR